MNVLDDVKLAAEQLSQTLGAWQPELSLVLGSGFAGLTEQLSDARSIAFNELPGFPPAGVSGHSGRIWFGDLCGTRVVVFQGRYHYYEGYDAYQVTAPVRLANALGCRRVLLTNAAGGISSQFSPGHFMLVTDHLNLVGDNPLRALSPAPFIDLSTLYQQSFYDDLKQSLLADKVILHQGTLAWLSGPSYETPAEINMLDALGADAVSMSTVPEAIMAHALGMETVAISLIANAAAGKATEQLCHEDVLAEGKAAASLLPVLVSRLLYFWK